MPVWFGCKSLPIELEIIDMKHSDFAHSLLILDGYFIAT